MDDSHSDGLRHAQEPAPKSEDEALVSIRRAPKFPVFLAAGAAVGVLAALILASVFPVDRNVGFGATFGLLALYGVPLGVLVAAVVAIVLDRRASRRAGTAIAGKLAVHVERGEHDDENTDGTAQG